MLASNTIFFVSPDGNDHNPGTIDLPLLTLAGARDKGRSVLNSVGDIKVYFRGGKYPFTKTVVFGLDDSGSENQVITYRLVGIDGEVLNVADDLWIMFYGRDGFLIRPGKTSGSHFSKANSLIWSKKVITIAANSQSNRADEVAAVKF